MSGERGAEIDDWDQYDPESLDWEILETVSANALSRLSALPQNRVLFYPAFGVDWQPIHWFSQVVDLIVYCGWTEREFKPNFDAPLREVGLDFHGHPFTPDLEAFLRDRRSLDPLPWSDECAVAGDGYAAGLRRIGSLEPVRAVVVVVRSDPAALYRNLFTAQSAAPDLLFLSKPVDVSDDDWGRFVAPGSALATAVRENPRPPGRLITEFAAHGWF